MDLAIGQPLPDAAFFTGRARECVWMDGFPQESWKRGPHKRAAAENNEKSEILFQAGNSKFEKPTGKSFQT